MDNEKRFREVNDIFEKLKEHVVDITSTLDKTQTV